MSNQLVGAALVAALTLTVHATRAADDEAQRITNEFSQENLICGAYHSLVSQCLANADPKDELVAKYRHTSLTFIERVVKVGRGVGISEKEFSAKVESAKQEMMLKSKASVPTSRFYWKSMHSAASACMRTDRNRSLTR